MHSMIHQRTWLGLGSACVILMSATPTTEPVTTCCFTNSRYSGVCEVVPSEDETCESILAYLNMPMSQGKTYCGGTDIRGGWKEVRCEDSRGERVFDRPLSPYSDGGGWLDGPRPCRRCTSRPQNMPCIALTRGELLLALVTGHRDQADLSEALAPAGRLVEAPPEDGRHGSS